MTGMYLKLKGAPKGIMVGAFLSAVSSWFKIVSEIDTAISGEVSGSIEWVVSNLSIGSLVIEVEPINKLEHENYAPEIMRVSIGGMRSLELEGLTPPYMTENG